MIKNRIKKLEKENHLTKNQKDKILIESVSLLLLGKVNEFTNEMRLVMNDYKSNNSNSMYQRLHIS